jgi:hypothetical protein
LQLASESRSENLPLTRLVDDTAIGPTRRKTRPPSPPAVRHFRGRINFVHAPNQSLSLQAAVSRRCCGHRANDRIEFMVDETAIIDVEL